MAHADLVGKGESAPVVSTVGPVFTGKDHPEQLANSDILTDPGTNSI